MNDDVLVTRSSTIHDPATPAGDVVVHDVPTAEQPVICESVVQPDVVERRSSRFTFAFDAVLAGGARAQTNAVFVTGGAFEPANAPTAEGGCEGATTPEPPQAPQICGDLIVYSTAISTSEEGTLYGSFEQPSGSGGFVGGTSTVTADAAAAPEIQTGAAAYSVGGTDYTC